MSLESIGNRSGVSRYGRSFFCGTRCLNYAAAQMQNSASRRCSITMVTGFGLSRCALLQAAPLEPASEVGEAASKTSVSL